MFWGRESFDEWGRGCRKLVAVLRGDSTKIVLPGDIFDQTPSEMSRVRGKLADHEGDHVVLSPEGAVLVTSPRMESLYCRFSTAGGGNSFGTGGTGGGVPKLQVFRN